MSVFLFTQAILPVSVAYATTEQAKDEVKKDKKKDSKPSASTGGSDVTDYDMYERANQAAQALGYAASPKGKASSGSSSEDSSAGLTPGKGDQWLLTKLTSGNDSVINAGQAGGLLGYADYYKDSTTGLTDVIKNAVTATNTQNSATYSYEQLEVFDKGAKGLENSRPFTTYAHYGYALSTLGVDKTGGVGFFSKIGAQILSAFRTLASLTAKFFQIAIGIMKALNPFALFGVGNDAATPTYQGEQMEHLNWTRMLGWASRDNTFVKFMTGPSRMITKMVSEAQSFAIELIAPAFLASTLLAIFLFRKSAGMHFMRFFYWIFMVFIGVPLIGSTYSGMLGIIENSLGHSSLAGDMIVLSNFVNFGGWARNSRLGLPDDIMRRDGYDSSSSWDENMRNYKFVGGLDAGVLAINAMASEDSQVSDFLLQQARSYQGDTSSGSHHQLLVDSYMDEEQSKRVDKYVRQYADKLLNGYVADDAGGAQTGRYTSSDYAGVINKELNAADKQDVREAIFTIKANDMIDDSDDNKYFGLFTDSGAQNAVNGTGGPAKKDSDSVPIGRYNIYNAGSLSRDSSGGFTSHLTDQNAGQGRALVYGSFEGVKRAGLSPLAMYNYLNSEFSTQGVTVYSTERMTSDRSQVSHQNIVFAGNAWIQFFRFLKAVVMLGAIVIMAFFFAWQLVKLSLSSFFQVFFGIVGSSLGSIGMVTRLMVMVGSILAQLLMTLVCYDLSVSIFFGLLKQIGLLLS